MPNENANKRKRNYTRFGARAKTNLFFASLKDVSSSDSSSSDSSLSDSSSSESMSDSGSGITPLTPPPRRNSTLHVITPPPPPPNLELVLYRPEEEGERPAAHDLLLDEEEVNERLWLDQQVERQVIAAIYKSVLKAPPPEEWKGRDGTFRNIHEILPDRSITTIKKVVPKVWDCIQRGEKYVGERKQRTFKGAYLIPDKSLHQRMICDWIERGLGISQTTKLLNRELIIDNLGEVGQTCVRETYLRLKPEVIPIRKVAQGTNDAFSPWCLASFNIAKQLAICVGVLDHITTVDPIMPDPLPGSK